MVVCPFPRFILAACLACLPAAASAAQQPAESPDQEASSRPAGHARQAENAAPVEIDGRAILLLYAPIAGLSPQERAESIEQRILDVARNRAVSVEVIHFEDRGAWTDILAGKDTLMVVTEGDALAAGRPRAQMAAEYAEIVRRTVSRYRQEHTWRALLSGALRSVIATGVLLLAVFVLLRLRRATGRRLESWIRKTQETYPYDSARSRIVRYVLLPLLGTGLVVVVFAALALVQVYVVYVLYSFPSTRFTSIQMNRWTLSEISGAGHAIWSYLPNLAIVIVIALLARALIRLNRLVFREIQEGRLSLHGFYPDWGAPTAKLIRLLILAATAIVVFPYLPGSNSPAFRGISVFLGVLLSLGSTSAVSHGVAGTILTYMRSFTVGDFVKIGDTVGEVVERNLLVTRIRTQKSEIVTIPNGSVLGGIVMNYSAEARKNGVIFYTRVSIGYNAPWRKVHELLIDAALATTDVLRSPSPFVLETSLDDFYVSYELNAFTARPQNMQAIYSDLHQNIQDKFNEAGIEINSPHYTSLRDGNRIAIPEAYVPQDYKEPGFGLRHLNGSATASVEHRESLTSTSPPSR